MTSIIMLRKIRENLDVFTPKMQFLSIFNGILESAVDGAPSQIPTLKFLTPPSTHKSNPGARLQQQNENSVQYVFYLLFVRTHTKSLV